MVLPHHCPQALSRNLAHHNVQGNVTENVSLLLHDLCEIRSEIKVKDSTFG